MNIYVLFMIASTVASVALFIYAVADNNSERPFFLIFISACTFLFSAGYLIEITAPTLEAAFTGIRIQKMGTPFLAILPYLFIRDIYGDKRFSFLRHCLIFTLPVFNVFTIQSFPHVKLHYTHIEYFWNGMIANCQGYPGPMSHIANIYNLIFFYLSIRRILIHMKRETKQQKGQSICLLTAILIPLFFYIYHALTYSSLRLDMNPFAVAISNVLLLYSVRIQNLLNIVPLARAKVIESMADAFIVCGRDFTFLDANKAAKQLFPELNTLAPGETMEQVKRLENEGEMCLQIDGEMRFYNISKTHIMQNNKNSAICIVFHDITHKENQLKKLYGKATFDPLMHVYNRATFFERSSYMLNTDKAKYQPYALLMIDLDHFKSVNDTYGHSCGDVVLETIAVMIKGHFRKNDIVGRYGGEEIVVLLEDINSEQTINVVEKLRKNIESRIIPCMENELQATVSIGIAHSPAGSVHSLEDMLAQADTAMYSAKQSGRNRACMYENNILI